MKPRAVRGFMSRTQLAPDLTARRRDHSRRPVLPEKPHGRPMPSPRSVYGFSSCPPHSHRYSTNRNGLRQAQSPGPKAAARTYDESSGHAVGHVCDLFTEEECYNSSRAQDMKPIERKPRSSPPPRGPGRKTPSMDICSARPSADPGLVQPVLDVGVRPLSGARSILRRWLNALATTRSRTKGSAAKAWPGQGRQLHDGGMQPWARAWKASGRQRQHEPRRRAPLRPVIAKPAVGLAATVAPT